MNREKEFRPRLFEFFIFCLFLIIFGAFIGLGIGEIINFFFSG